ncbi:hypothetical protein BCR34DRAFT_556293 [Clohesyomyces aquaticus]|uniref:BTB domain-containing protein n=1 Tax=Clohesyomyces aquaticus TaxID=1231657 RepID=A0A1Y2A3T1_9PLEO|nr:hypothetical protein BCR34DRAFT_556293 [Clohesyomyces aquaticus]
MMQHQNSTSTQSASRIIVLDVSGCKFRTTKSALETSDFFQSLLARWEDCADRQEDGSYFIDADPEAFEHLLNFMRRPGTFPLFWTNEQGFDYALYNKLQAEADYYLVHDLRDWIQEKRYLEAVKTVTSVRNVSTSSSTTEVEEGTGNVSIQTYIGPLHRGRYLCPLAEKMHDEPWRCTESCRKARGTNPPHFEKKPGELTKFIKRVVFDQDVCINEGRGNT